MNLNRRSIRLKGYDYSKPGMYFITICTKNRQHMFGEIKDGQVHLNECGNMANKHLIELPNRFSNIKIDEHIIMPDHIHAIIEILEPPQPPKFRPGSPCGCLGEKFCPNEGQPQGLPLTPTPAPPPLRGARAIGNIIGAYKSIITTEYIKNVKRNNWPPFNKSIWHRNYYERIIWNNHQLHNTRQYIKNNPHNHKQYRQP